MNISEQSRIRGHAAAAVTLAALVAIFVWQVFVAPLIHHISEQHQAVSLTRDRIEGLFDRLQAERKALMNLRASRRYFALTPELMIDPKQAALALNRDLERLKNEMIRRGANVSRFDQFTPINLTSGARGISAQLTAISEWPDLAAAMNESLKFMSTAVLDFQIEALREPLGTRSVQLNLRMGIFLAEDSNEKK